MSPVPSIRSSSCGKSETGGTETGYESVSVASIKSVGPQRTVSEKSYPGMPAKGKRRRYRRASSRFAHF